jgi:prepilin-type N-terminal cleavage/methylation domain-containing protein
MLTKLANRDEKGFTLIELMIVIAIIGILAAIAIPQFSAYRKRAFNASAESDVRNLATAQEAYYVDFSKYTGDTTALGTFGYMQSNNVSASMAINGDAQSYTISAFHTAGGDHTYTLAGPGGVIE